MRIAAVVLGLLQLASVSSQSSWYTIDWSQVSSTATSPATSSEAAASGVCSCDLTSNKCDVDCCCDPDCSQAQQKALFSCCCHSMISTLKTQAGTQPFGVDTYIACCRIGDYISDPFGVDKYGRHCAVNSDIDTAILNVPNVCPSASKQYADPSWMLDCANTRREGWSFWRHLFCVETSNALTHNFTDIYFPDQSTSTLTPTLIDGFGAKAAEGLYLHTTSYTGGSVGYKAGEPMLAIYSSVVVGAPGNTLANFYLPTRDYGGSCDGRRPVRFMRDVDSSETECLFHFTSLESSCSALSALDASSYTSNIFVALQSNGTVLPPTSTSQWTGVRYAIAKGSFGTTQVASSGTVNTGLTSPWYSPHTHTCYNVVRKVHYYVTYDPATGHITDVAASTTVTDVSDNGVTSVKAGFGVSFLDGTRNASYATPRSGTPGYIPGAKLLAGYLKSYGSKQAMAQLVEGATVIAPGPGGACSSDAKLPIRFKVDMKTECTKSLDEAALKAYCEAGNIPAILQVNYTSLGMFGSAWIGHTSNWTALSYIESTPTAVWNQATKSCSSLITGLKYNVLWGYFGQVGLGQQAISQVRVEWETSTWQYPNDGSTGAIDFKHMTSVSFINIQNQKYERYPSFEPLISAVPDDIFHPFYPNINVNSAARQGGTGLLAMSLVLAAAVWASGGEHSRR